MEHYYKINKDGYLVDPYDENHIIPFENLLRVEADVGSYCIFHDINKLTGKISCSVGVVFEKINHPDFVRPDDDYFINMNFIKHVRHNKPGKRTREIEFPDCPLLETSVRRTQPFLKTYRLFKKRKILQQKNDDTA